MFLFLFLNYPILLMAEVTEKIEKNSKVEPFSLMNMLNTVMGLVVVIAVILVLAWAVKKYGQLPDNNRADMKILGGLSLGTREKAVLIEVEGKKLLLGVAPGRIETLHILDDAHVGNDFNKNLNDAMEAS